MRMRDMIRGLLYLIGAAVVGILVGNVINFIILALKY